jgi:hypothetical protein
MEAFVSANVTSNGEEKACGDNNHHRVDPPKAPFN